MPRKYHPNRRRRGRPPTTGKNQMIAIRWPKALLDGIERYAQDQMLERGPALRQLVTRALVEKGFLDPGQIYTSTAPANFKLKAAQ
jgi:hypothetical protein